MESAALRSAKATRVTITGGTAVADTRLTAFDGALHAAGLHDGNLVEISSIVPADATVERAVDPEILEERIAPGAYVPTVYAFAASRETGETVHAAVAGARLAAGHGVNVEHHGRNQDPERVQLECEAMIEEMAALRDTQLTDEQWFHCERTGVPDGDRWAGAVAAMAYTDHGVAD